MFYLFYIPFLYLKIKKELVGTLWPFQLAARGYSPPSPSPRYSSDRNIKPFENIVFKNTRK